VQTIGRAARNINGLVLLYADTITDSMGRAIEETNRRREVQHAYNVANGVEPYTIKKEVRETVRSYEVVKELSAQYNSEASTTLLDDGTPLRLEDIPMLVAELERKMKDLAKAMEFEKAAEVRDEIAGLRKLAGLGEGRKIGQEKRRMPGRSRQS